MDSGDLGADPFADSTGWLSAAAIVVPVSRGELPDGTPTLVIGDVRGDAAFNHLQGDNPDHDCGDCGIVCCAEVLDHFGVMLTEAEVVRHAARLRELHVVAGHPEQSGWTLPAELRSPGLRVIRTTARWRASTSTTAARASRGCSSACI